MEKKKKAKKVNLGRRKEKMCQPQIDRNKLIMQNKIHEINEVSRSPEMIKH